MTVDDAAFARLIGSVSGAVGMTLAAYKDKCIRRRVAVRMRACGARSYDEYRDMVERTPGELERLRDALTINVTRFYRNPETWNALAARFLPGLWERNEGRLLAWSAGCASGDEPYTMAMLIAEQCRTARHPDWLDRATIHATDVDRVSLERARSGAYREDAFQDLPLPLRERYTEATDTGRAVVPAIRDRVQVSELDLSGGRPHAARYQLIVCRNVVIYFDRPLQERLFSIFAGHLADDGVLVLGKVETLLGPARELMDLVDVRERIYRRRA
ncbi:MAG TPA: protein-glutamate O-methyltransferase CheR [Gemmatimonadales bacterium]|jgi:chemotaxis methyl-accepting protein methylase|nr:protein-glutamate O-methyltransferase CheR [Gemmatimonadales bacterium]